MKNQKAVTASENTSMVLGDLSPYDVTPSALTPQQTQDV